MKIVLCNGGLGNQVFQYIFSRYIELSSGEKCYLDDSSFWGNEVEHNGFEMKTVFPYCRPRLLSHCFTEDVWEYMVKTKEEGIGICQQLKESGVNLTLVAETDDYVYDGNIVCVPTNAYMPRLAKTSGDIYFHGYWINKNWLKDTYWDILRGELQFNPITDTKNLQYLSDIKNSEAVMLHVRRGDFLKYHRDAPALVYRESVNYMKSKISNPHFFVFSDEIIWCKENKKELGLDNVEVTYIEGNTRGNSYIDMQLMAYCKNMILITSSSFSYLAVLLNQNATVAVYNRTLREI